MAEQTDIDLLFRQAQEQRTAEPPAMAWDRISETLDVDATWKRINNSLDAQAASRRRMAILLFGLFGIITVSVLLFTLKLRWNENKAVASAIKHPAALKIKKVSRSNTTGTTTSSVSNNNGTVNATARPLASDVAANANAAANTTIPGKTAQTNQDKMPRITGKNNLTQKSYVAASRETTISQYPSPLPVGSITSGMSNETPSLLSLLTENEDSTASRPLRFSFSVFAGARESWLWDKGDFTSLRGDSSGSSAESSMILRPSAGIGFAYQLRQRLSLNSSLYIISGGGQCLQQNNAGQTATDRLRLDYSSLSAGFGMNTNRVRYTNLFSTYGTLDGGLIFSYLRRYNEIAVDSRSILAENSYRNFDLGIYAGYTQYFCFNRRLALAPSVRWQQGLLNITTRPEKVPSSLSRAFNASLEAQLALRISF